MIKAPKRGLLRYLFLSCAFSLMISCASTPPLPSNITFFESPTDISSELRAFFGTWKGKWYSSQDVMLVVERIDSNYAEVIFSLGYISAVGLNPQNTFYYVRTDVINDSTIGWATANNNKFIFEMQDGFNAIKGYFIEGSTGAKIPASLTRTNISELPDITIRNYPYVEYNHPLKSTKDFDHDNNQCWRKAEKQNVLLSPDIKRYKMWEELNRCLRDDFGWKLRKG